MAAYNPEQASSRSGKFKCHGHKFDSAADRN
jgi:hypothetical protein